MATKEAYELGKSQNNLYANSKVLVKREGKNIAKMLFKQETGNTVVVNIIEIHADDLTQECSIVVSSNTTI